jgi:hypothetical protein
VGHGRIRKDTPVTYVSRRSAWRAPLLRIGFEVPKVSKKLANTHEFIFQSFVGRGMGTSVNQEITRAADATWSNTRHKVA